MSIGPPRLYEFSCEVKTQKSVNSTNDKRTCVINFKIDENNSPIGETSRLKNVSVQLEPSTLDALLDGLHRVQNHLSTVASKQLRS